MFWKEKGSTEAGKYYFEKNNCQTNLKKNNNFKDSKTRTLCHLTNIFFLRPNQ